MSMNRRTHGLFGSVLAAGSALLVWIVGQTSAGTESGAIALIVASFVTGLLIVELSTASAESATFALVFAAQLGYGTDVAIMCAAAGEIGSALRPPLPRFHRSWFNVCAHTLAAAGQGLLLQTVGADVQSLMGAVIWLVPASLLYFGISSMLVAWGIGWSGNVKVISFWSQNFRWIAPHYPALALVGMVLARGQLLAGSLGVLVFALPLLMSHYSVEVFVRKTRAQMEALESANVRLEAMNAALTDTLGTVVEARDLYLSKHSHQASEYTEKIARYLALPESEIQLAKQGALLHDVGKVGIPEGILRKPSALDDHERNIMNSHSAIGAEIVSRTIELAEVAPIVRAHHERFDGKGYPDGLAGDQIPAAARIICVLEAFDAMISDRPYRKALSIDDALEEIQRCRGSQFDPDVVDALFAVIREDGRAWLGNSAGHEHTTHEDLFLPISMRHAETSGNPGQEEGMDQHARV